MFFKSNNNKIISDLKILEERFNELDEQQSEQLLGSQFRWEDHFTQNIYKQELKDGIIKLYIPENLFLLNEIDESLLWTPNEFFSIINQWSNEVPKFKFNSIGAYLLFFKSIYFKDFSNAKKSIEIKTDIDLNLLKTNYINLSGNNRKGWKRLEKYFFTIGLEIVNSKYKEGQILQIKPNQEPTTKN